MHPDQLSRALSAADDIARHAAAGDMALAQQARATLDELAARWSEELGKLAYPEPVRERLRAAGLRQYPV